MQCVFEALRQALFATLAADGSEPGDDYVVGFESP